jgi:hypothetical protein
MFEQYLSLFLSFWILIYWFFDQFKCSFIPTACQNDPNYLADIIKELHAKLFPPLNFPFHCFTKKEMKRNNLTNDLNSSEYSIVDALMYIPDHSAYYLSLVFLSFGIFVSVFLYLFAFCLFYLNSEARKKHIGEYKNRMISYLFWLFIF